VADIPTVAIGGLRVSRLIIGGNPFSGISHQTSEMNEEMRDWYTAARIKAVLAECERCGVNTFQGRCDNHICRLVREYRNEGGRIQFFAQTAPEIASLEQNIRQAAYYNAQGCYLQGSQTQALWEAGRFDEIRDRLDQVRGLGMVAGLAAHDPAILLDLAGRGVKPDFYMVCFYNVTGHRGDIVRHAEDERFQPRDREAAVAAIRRLDRPCIGYKVLAAGRNQPAEAFDFAFRNIKPTDAVCVGMYTGRQPDQVAQNARLVREAIAKASG
jgi:hypothetical protein